jgi:hypothetical protein
VEDQLILFHTATGEATVDQKAMTKLKIKIMCELHTFRKKARAVVVASQVFAKPIIVEPYHAPKDADDSPAADEILRAEAEVEAQVEAAADAEEVADAEAFAEALGGDQDTSSSSDSSSSSSSDSDSSDPDSD